MPDGCLMRTEKENVLIQSGDCSLQLLPQMGGKIGSIRVNGRELLHAPLAPITTRTSNMPFDASDASGWDECLPSVAACRIATASGSADIPDHGDLWRVTWETRESDDTSVTLRGTCFSLPLTLERTIALTQNGQGWQIKLDYKLTNNGRNAVPWSWAAHPLFAVDSGDTLELPATITSLRVEGSGGNRLGKADDTIAWPIAKITGGSTTDLRLAQAPQAGIGDKLFAGPLTANENWCILHRPSAGVRIRFTFDTALTPYLGLWLCYGGWPDKPGPKQNCIAPEPSTAPVDSLAQSGPWSRTLQPGESFAWPMIVDLGVI